MNSWPTVATHRAWLVQHCLELLDFGRRFPHPAGGSAWLTEDGAPDLDRPVFTYITARMAHVYSLGVLLGVPGCGPLADAALAGLIGGLRDLEYGGWYESTTDQRKTCYAHAFVVLGASSAVVARRAGAPELLADALAVLEHRFWDETAGMCVDSWDRPFAICERYRGMNANMHTVEALLAAADVTGSSRYRDMAGRISAWLVDSALSRWRVQEHFDASWNPMPDYHRDCPDDPFRPYGATVGHGLEWSRLLLQLDRGLYLPPARFLFDRAVQDGWSADGAPGFVYTTDWDGRPIVRDRMHWVAAEAIGAAAALYRATGDDKYAERYAEWWDYVATYLLDRQHGSWHHQLNPANQPTATVWPGKPDLYHAVQATLLPLLPLAPSLATALAHQRDGLL